jgi:hypothetical protein
LIIGNTEIVKYTGEYMYIHDLLFNKCEVDESVYSKKTNTVDYHVILNFFFREDLNNPSLPLFALKNNDIKICINIRNLSQCYHVTPTHYIECQDIFVLFTKYDDIYQNINGKKIFGIFSHFDPTKKLLYYTSINGTFVSNYIIHTYSNDYYTATPKSNSIIYINYALLSSIENINIRNAYIIADYTTGLSKILKSEISKKKNVYLIEQVYRTANVPIDGNYKKFQIVSNNLCKSIYFLTQCNYIYDSNYLNIYNYTHVNNKKYQRVDLDNNMIEYINISLNNQKQYENFDPNFFNVVDVLSKYKSSIHPGIFIYTPCLYPTKMPSGTLNTSIIKTIEIELYMNNSIINEISNGTNVGYINTRGYATTYNFLEIHNGEIRLLFPK